VNQTPLRCSVIRGGTSKGLYFHAEDLPTDPATRDKVLLAAMGSPDVRQIDGMGGAHPLTSKVAIVRPSRRSDADVDYLFLQVWPDRAEVADNQNCGNLLAGIGPFALEEGLIKRDGDTTAVRIWMENTDSLAVAQISTPEGYVEYEGDAHIDGVPGTHSAIPIEFVDIAGSTCGNLLPSGNASDIIEGVRVTCIDNGMPVVCVAARDLGLRGDESPSDIESNRDVCERVEAIRRGAGPLMNLGDVSERTVPKVSLVSAPTQGGALNTRTFIPERVHEAIGVLGAVSVASACVIPGTVVSEIADISGFEATHSLDIEHPSGYFSVDLEIDVDGGNVVIQRCALLRTARLLMRGEIFVPHSIWPGR
jgi:4-oxalomesaconate tautomerase